MFLESEVRFVDRFHDSSIVELLELGEHRLFAFVSKFLDALLQVILSHNDAL